MLRYMLTSINEISSCLFYLCTKTQQLKIQLNIQSESKSMISEKMLMLGEEMRCNKGLVKTFNSDVDTSCPSRLRQKPFFLIWSSEGIWWLCWGEQLDNLLVRAVI